MDLTLPRQGCDMSYKINQIGHQNGDKWMNGIIPNMKIGELRYYPQDNPNLYRNKSKELSPKTLTRIFKTLFPDYEVEINESDRSLIDHIVQRRTSQYIINKAYICIKETTPTNDGTVINLHNGYILVFKEKIAKKIKECSALQTLHLNNVT